MINVGYWSRYNRTAVAMDPMDMTLEKCHKPIMRRGYVDLGGVILSLKRLLSDSPSFMSFGDINCQDGMMFSKLLTNFRWRVLNVNDCLFSHSPNPFMCSKLNGLWHLSPSSLDEVSKACWSFDEFMLKKAYLNLTLQERHSGITFIEYADSSDREKYNRLFERDKRKFEKEAYLKLRESRRHICERRSEKIIASFNYSAYRDLNIDLLAFTDSQLLHHFVNSGCYEGRPIWGASSDYF